MGILKNLLSTVAAYVPTEWATGDIITADKLNHMENGIGNAIIGITHPEAGVDQLTATWQDIHDIFITGKAIFVEYTEQIGPDPVADISIIHSLITSVSSATQSEAYTVSDGQMVYTSSSADDYPLYTVE